MAISTEHEFNAALGQRLMKIRQSRRMSQAQLGAHIGVKYQQIQKYESGLVRITPMKLAVCAKIFEVGIDYFYGTDKESTDSGYSKAVLNIANEVNELPTIELKRSVFILAKEINRYVSEDEDQENADVEKLRVSA